MKLVFLAGPFRGDGSEEAKRRRIAKAREFVRVFIQNEIPYYSPHLNISEATIEFGALKDDYANEINADIFEHCSILAVLPDWKESSGTKKEIERAKEREIPIVYLEEAGAVERLKDLVK